MRLSGEKRHARLIVFQTPRGKKSELQHSAALLVTERNLVANSESGASDIPSKHQLFRKFNSSKIVDPLCPIYLREYGEKRIKNRT